MDDDYPFDVGTHHRSTTGAPEGSVAAAWFDRGLVWMCAFHHEEAIRCFDRCTAAAAASGGGGCALAHALIAFSHGPNYNVHKDNYYLALAGSPGFPSWVEAHASLARAEAAATVAATPTEVALVQALRARYGESATAPASAAAMALCNEAFATAMREVHARFPTDADVACLFAEALMDVAPWQLYDQDGVGTEATQVAEALAALSAGLAQAPRHPGLCHLKIHLLEMSPHPERALDACRVLAGAASDGVGAAAPSCPHLLHMPSHVYVLTGDYDAAVAVNVAAVRANDAVYSNGAGTPFYVGYAAHDYHMLVYAAMLAGQEAAAMRYAGRIREDLVPVSLLRQPGMAGGMEHFLSVEALVRVRFGRWADILAAPLPPTGDALFAATRATMRLARGLALAATGLVAEAEAEERLFLAAVVPMELTLPDGGAPAVPRQMHNNDVADVLGVGKLLLRGEILYRRAAQEKGGGGFEEAFSVLRDAVAADDRLNYDEPWGMMVPTRHALGALLLEQGRTVEAADVFRSDMSGRDASGEGLLRHNRHPENVWALVGLESCFVARGAAGACCGGSSSSCEESGAATTATATATVLVAERRGPQEAPAALAARVAKARSAADVEVRSACGCVVGTTRKE